ncbi:polyprenyl synthetase family protein [Streptomyces montanisoli]|uniref:Polyprenyl synthetase family protein n=1 Tax=Streptomyces montanisoli TaxID=2798581 RepID=A0A940MEI1_9ACTN|nr:polyprenyl synthetase family protein [Streptomyces montanisoli]MBP0457651.1 polyprenyl synthetase family protein [Streptomyces montanisoli]
MRRQSTTTPDPSRSGEGPPSRLPPDAFDGIEAPIASQGEVPGRVELVLRHYLDERRAETASLAAPCADDLVDRLSALVLTGGKRLRPAFLWCGWRASGGTGAGQRALLRVGAALELLQGCALVHDDLMDASAVRRGRPSLHRAFTEHHLANGLGGSPAQFGASAALLAGDLALLWAQDLMEEADLPAAARQRCARLWRAMRTEMVTGQYLELSAQAARSCTPDEALRIAHLKAGLYTVQRPLAMGAVIAGAGEEIREPLERAGERAGLAFQLRDDLLDLFGDSSRTGRPKGEDVRQGKPTYVMTVGLHNARSGGHEAAARVLDAAQGDQGLTEQGLARVRGALIDVGARAHVERLISELEQEALKAVAALRLDPATAGDLQGLISRAAGVAAPPAAPGTCGEEGA